MNIYTASQTYFNAHKDVVRVITTEGANYLHTFVQRIEKKIETLDQQELEKDQHSIATNFIAEVIGTLYFGAEDIETLDSISLQLSTRFPELAMPIIIASSKAMIDVLLGAVSSREEIARSLSTRFTTLHEAYLLLVSIGQKLGTEPELPKYATELYLSLITKGEFEY